MLFSVLPILIVSAAAYLLAGLLWLIRISPDPDQKASGWFEILFIPAILIWGLSLAYIDQRISEKGQ